MAWWTPLECSSSSPGKEGGRGDTGWAQPNLSLCDWSACELPGRDGWRLLGNSKSKKRMEMRMREALCKQQNRGMLRGGKAEDGGMKKKTFAVLVPTQLKIWKFVFSCLFEFSWLFSYFSPFFSQWYMWLCLSRWEKVEKGWFPEGGEQEEEPGQGVQVSGRISGTWYKGLQRGA